MKKILISLSLLLMAVITLVSCGDGNRIDQKGEIAIPQEPTIVGIKSVPGGAVIKVSIPDDPNLKGVVATYQRNGATVESRISRYLDTLVVEGYADENEHDVVIRSFNANDDKSEGQTVKITPLVAPVKTAKFEAFESFGGIKIRITDNPTLAKLALVVQCDQTNPDQDLAYDQRKWKDVSTFFTESNSVVLTRRGLEAVPTVFAFHFRDDFGNVSETQLIKLTPKEDPFAFTDIYRTGIEQIDQEHEHLFEIVRETNDLIHNNLLHDKYDEIIHLINELKEYTSFHFADEEAYMESINYPGLDAQKRAHTAFVDRIMEIDIDTLDEIDDHQQEYLEELITFLASWLTNHILKMDKAIGC